MRLLNEAPLRTRGPGTSLGVMRQPGGDGGFLLPTANLRHITAFLRLNQIKMRREKTEESTGHPQPRGRGSMENPDVTQESPRGGTLFFFLAPQPNLGSGFSVSASQRAQYRTCVLTFR